MFKILGKGGHSNGIIWEEREGLPPCSDRRRLLPPQNCCRSDARSDRPRTSPTSDARCASSRSGRGALPFRAGALPRFQHPWHVVAPSSLAARKPRLDLLEQPAVPVRILERGKRKVGTTLRVTPNDAWVFHGVVEGATGIVKNLAHVDALGGQVVTGGIDVVHRQDRRDDRTRLGGSDPLCRK